jgi:hypothetical protein
MRRVVAVRQIWREEVGRKKEPAQCPYAYSGLPQTDSLQEDIQPISQGMIITDAMADRMNVFQERGSLRQT